jgi:hypothetical protein
MKGLQPGDREEAVLRRYPNAELRRRSWWLKTSISLIGSRREFPVVEATIGTAGPGPRRPRLDRRRRRLRTRSEMMRGQLQSDQEAAWPVRSRPPS